MRAARERLLPLDLVFIELKLQHLTDRTVLRRLRHELVLPARALGCRSIWLGGISLGGYLAIAYAERYPQEIDGLCLFAPYLGNHIVTGEIERANGVRGWDPGKVADDDDERRIWRFIKEHPNRRAAEGIPRSASGATDAQQRESREAPAARRGATRGDAGRSTSATASGIRTGRSVRLQPSADGGGAGFRKYRRRSWRPRVAGLAAALGEFSRQEVSAQWR